MLNDSSNSWGKTFNKYDTGVIVKNNKKNIRSNVKIKDKLEGWRSLIMMVRKYGSIVLWGSKTVADRYMESSLDRLAINLCDASGIQCDRSKGDMELVNICNKHVALLQCKGWKTEKMKNLDENMLERNFEHTSRFWGCTY